jgi:hypothetical protein
MIATPLTRNWFSYDGAPEMMSAFCDPGLATTPAVISAMFSMFLGMGSLYTISLV